jgi:hypothetical protein
MLTNIFNRNKWRNYLMAHKINGHWFYTYKNVQLINNARMKRFQLAIKDLENGVSKADIKACIRLAMNAIEAGKPIEAATYLQTLNTYTDLLYSDTLMFNIAEPIILMENEAEEPEGEYWTLKKKDAYQNSESVQGFFLSIAEKTSRDTRRLLSDISIEAYLRQEQVKKIESLFLNLIGGQNQSNI